MIENDDLGLLLLHALPLDGAMWAEQMSLVPNRTYAPNLYEFGDNIQDWAQKSLSLVREKRLIVVGCSVGGSCALEVARIAGDRVEALVLIGTKARHDPNPKFYRESLEYVRSQGVEAAWETYWRPLFDGPCDSAVVQLARDMALNQTKEKLTNGLSAFHTRPSLDLFIANSELPIHVVSGDQDPLPGLSYSEELAATAKNGRLHILNSSGHYVPMIQAQAFNSLLSGIISAHMRAVQVG